MKKPGLMLLLICLGASFPLAASRARLAPGNASDRFDMQFTGTRK